ncbi:MAG: CDP-glycerol glycerophosphotransferase family protein [Treponema sp.]|nr:CDP-glycerol glycerophosphotransferase family protein [Treponema sp.]
MTFLYIDPGTGSMLFSLFIGGAAALVFAARALSVKLKFVFTGGRGRKNDGERLPFVIYSDHKRYWNVFKPICDEAERRGLELVYYTQSADDPALSARYTHVRSEFIGEGNRGVARMNLLTADLVLSTTPGLGVLQWKRSRGVSFYVHIPHLAGDLTTYRMFALDHYDAVLLTGDYQGKDVRELEKLRGLPEKELITVGCTYMDGMKARLSSSPRPHNERPCVLLAPSWGRSGLLTVYGRRLLDALAASGFDIVIRPHPQSLTAEKELLDSLAAAYRDCTNVSWNYDNDNFDILNRADVMITDFSGVIFDFSLVFGKPVIYSQSGMFNSDPYDAWWLDHELWTFTVLPKLGVALDEKDFPRIGKLIRNTIESPVLKDGIDGVREESWAHVGESAARVVDYMQKKRNGLRLQKRA